MKVVLFLALLTIVLSLQLTEHNKETKSPKVKQACLEEVDKSFKDFEKWFGHGITNLKDSCFDVKVHLNAKAKTCSINAHCKKSTSHSREEENFETTFDLKSHEKASKACCEE